eukprot:6332977-Ditylum_brightwellii.AAC.1
MKKVPLVTRHQHTYPRPNTTGDRTSSLSIYCIQYMNTLKTRAAEKAAMNDSTASARHNDSESPEVEPSTMSNISNPLPTDVICGRGGGALRHAGNLTYRNIVALNKGLYTTCKKSDKLKISRSIVAAIRETNGRFLEQDSVTKLWNDIGDKKAVEKTSQALREGQPKLRKKIIELETQG